MVVNFDSYQFAGLDGYLLTCCCQDPDTWEDGPLQPLQASLFYIGLPIWSEVGGRPAERPIVMLMFGS